MSSTFTQLVDLGDRAPSTLSGVELIEELRARHEYLMALRPNPGPGKFKVEANIAGATTFVAPGYVKGTLHALAELLKTIDHPFGRAVLLHFGLTEIHPFAYGNGRISRIMMTKELLSAGLCRIIVPTVYRDDYVGALRALSRHDDPTPIVRALARLQEVANAAAAPSVEAAIQIWASTYAFVEPGEHARLEMPDRNVPIVWNGEVPAPATYWEAVNRQNTSITGLKL